MIKTSLSKQALLSLILLLLLIVQRPPEEHDVWLRAMNCIVDPPTALLNPNSTPFILKSTQQNINFRAAED